MFASAKGVYEQPLPASLSNMKPQMPTHPAWSPAPTPGSYSPGWYAGAEIYGDDPFTTKAITANAPVSCSTTWQTTQSPAALAAAAFLNKPA